MKPTWVIENYSNDNSQKELAYEVSKQGFKCIIITPVGDNPLPDIFPTDVSSVIFHGTINGAERIQKEKPQWIPGAIASFHNYDYTKIYHNIIFPYILNKDYGFYRLDDLISEKWFLYRKFGKDAEIWVRPNSSKKPFTGGLVNIEEYDRFIENDVKPNCKPDDIIIISSPKEINSEFRFVVSPDGIVSQCCYFYQKNRVYIPSAPVEATELCKELIKTQYFPDYFFVIDICEDTAGKYYLLEYNAFSTSGLYACNKQMIVSRISNYAELDV